MQTSLRSGLLEPLAAFESGGGKSPLGKALTVWPLQESLKAGLSMDLDPKRYLEDFN